MNAPRSYFVEVTAVVASIVVVLALGFCAFTYVLDETSGLRTASANHAPVTLVRKTKPSVKVFASRRSTEGHRCTAQR